MTTTAPNIFTPIGGRRMFLTFLGISCATALCAYDKMSGGEWGIAAGAFLAFFNAANSYQKKVEAENP